MLPPKIYLTAAITLALSASFTAKAEWSDFLNSAIKVVSENGGGELAQSSLSNSEVITGLKEALANGVQSAITTLGTSGGFANNEAVKISLPDSLKSVATTARLLGQGEYVDSLETTMNQAAEQAVPEAASILGDAIKSMSVTDAMSILNGSDDAATQYFRKVSEASLTEKFKPIISQATDSTGVTANYKTLTSQATPLLEGITGSKSSLDIDQYITTKSLDGLFQYIAKEEKSIRANPAARTTDILKKVFSN